MQVTEKMHDVSFRYKKLNKPELRSLSPRANYTDREIAACRRGYC
jgi:hypothetical protein